MKVNEGKSLIKRLAVGLVAVTTMGCTDAQLAQAQKAIAAARSPEPSAVAQAPVPSPAVTASPSPVATPTPEPTQAPLSFAGASRTGLSAPFQLQAGPRKFTATHAGTSNFIVRLNDAKGASAGMLFNEIGTYSGTYATFIKTAGTYYLDVSAADGAWSIKVE